MNICFIKVKLFEHYILHNQFFFFFLFLFFFLLNTIFVKYEQLINIEHLFDMFSYNCYSNFQNKI